MTEIPKQSQRPEGKDQERHDVAQKIRNALSNLQTSIGNTKESNVETQNKVATDLISALAKAGVLKIIAEGKINDPELLALMKYIEVGNKPNAKEVVTMLTDEGEAKKDLSVLADEITAVDKYLAQPVSKITPSEKAVALNERIQKFVTDKLPANAIKELAGKFKMDLKPEQIVNIRKFITNMITMTIAGAIEKFPGMGKAAGNLRWGIVLSQAKAPDSGLTADQKKQMDNPEKLGQIKNEWTRNYMSWLTRKKAAITRGLPLAEGVPTIAGVFAKRNDVAAEKVKKDNEPDPKKLFGIKGLEQNKEFEITKETPIQIGGKEVKISKDKITVGDKNKKLTLKDKEGSKVEAIKLLTSSQTPTDLTIRFKIGNKIIEKQLNKDIVSKFAEPKITLNKDPDLILEPLKT